ncbi:MAG: hypothetical protein K8Q91_02625 [Candidatus Vogelbacteria bacterium]|nr:hypothetical protein [Candidatus Vogelbacteria bacterium]
MSNMLGSPRANLFGLGLDFMNKLNTAAITPLQARRFLRREDPWVYPMDTDSQLNRVCSVYADFGVKIKPSSVIVPERKSGFERLLVLPGGLLEENLIVILRQMFSVTIISADNERPLPPVAKNNRTAEETYGVWVRDSIEADPLLAGLPIKELKERGVNGMTLRERLVYELVYFSETGQHLDVKTKTLCSGSYHRDHREDSDYSMFYSAEWCEKKKTSQSSLLIELWGARDYGHLCRGREVVE